jgi:polysaccharide deacetylase family protein (PEP-CTERM system associated)
MEVSCVSALTVDVEDAINLTMRNVFRTNMEPTIRVYDNVMYLLDLFSEYNTFATFFILGEVANTYPELIKEIARRGHELGIHGYSHARYYHLSKEKVRDEILKAKQMIEDISGIKVIGHRAPEFSINKKTLWVLEILLDACIKYDSSIFPSDLGRYSWPGFNKDISFLELNDGRKIIEAPLSVVKWLGRDFPACGGSYLRIFPDWVTNLAFKQINRERPVVLYMHPYEIDLPPFQDFYMDAIYSTSCIKQLMIKRYWFNRHSVIPKLIRMLNTYRFNTLRNVISETLKTEF